MSIERWGDAGPVVLCVHGIGSSRRDFARLGAELAPTHRIVAYDQRGHGDASEGSMSLEALAKDFEAVAASVAPVSVVIGHSWGGAVALKGAPRVTKAMILIDPLISIAPHSFDGDYVDDLQSLLRDPPGPEREQAIRAAFSEAHPVDREGKVHAMQRLDVESVRRLGRENGVDTGAWNLRRELAEVTIPVVVLRAGIESVVSDEDLAGLPPSVRVETFAADGHTLHRSSFTRFVQIVREVCKDATP